MTDFLPSFAPYLFAYKYVALFVIVFASSFIVPMPLNEIILVAGVFANLGYLNLIAIILVALLTNVLADICGYWLAYKYETRIFHMLRIKQNANFFKAKHYMENYAYGTIFISKIMGPFGPWVNFISGLIRLPFRKFLLFDILGNATDVLFFACAGYFVGSHWHQFLADLWIIAVIVVLVFGGYIIYKTRFRKIKGE